MNTAPHEFVTVDMRGLKAALVARARARRVSLSAVVRDAVARSLPSNAEADVLEMPGQGVAMCEPSSTVKLSIRLTRDEVERLDAGARTAGISRAAFLSGLIDGVAVLSSGGRRDHLAALLSSSSELSTLSRNIRHLADLLRRSQSSAAKAYRAMLDTLASDIDRHLRLVGDVLSPLRPVSRAAAADRGRSSLAKEKH